METGLYLTFAVFFFYFRKLDGLVGDTISLKDQANNAHCSYTLIGKSFYTFGVGFAFPKDSPWLEKATLSVLKHQENGTIERIKTLRFPSKTCPNSKVPQFDISDFSGLFLTVFGVVVFGILAIFTELFLISFLTKHWRWLGYFGRKLRHFLLEIKSNEEDVEFHFFKPFGERSWDLNHGKRTLHNGNGSNGVNGRAGFKNYGFSVKDFHDNWMNSSRVSCRSLSFNDTTEDGHKTVEISNGTTSTTMQGTNAEEDAPNPSTI